MGSKIEIELSAESGWRVPCLRLQGQKWRCLEVTVADQEERSSERWSSPREDSGTIRYELRGMGDRRRKNENVGERVDSAAMYSKEKELRSLDRREMDRGTNLELSTRN
jgi:hypothetical protein